MWDHIHHGTQRLEHITRRSRAAIEEGDRLMAAIEAEERYLRER